MITAYRVSNFKSLVGFKMPAELPHVVFLIGPNGAGKSAVLQSLGLLGRLATGHVSGWLKERGWEARELKSQFSHEACAFSVEVALSDETIRWEGRFDYETLRCTTEEVFSGEGVVQLRSAAGRCQIGDSVYDVSALDFEGSVLSALRESQLLPPLRQLKEFLQRVSLMDQLSTSALRRRSRKAVDVGAGGERLAGFLDSVPTELLLKIYGDFRAFFHGADIQLESLSSGWKRLYLLEDRFEYVDRSSLEASAKHGSAGQLRVLAMVAQTYSDRSVILLDEIENGIYPELLGKLVDYLQMRARVTGKQFWITTHSPMVLNYLEDDVARQSVYLVRRNEAGFSQAELYFGHEATSRKLGVMGPGEVFADTPLSSLTQKRPEPG